MPGLKFKSYQTFNNVWMVTKLNKCIVLYPFERIIKNQFCKYVAAWNNTEVVTHKNHLSLRLENSWISFTFWKFPFCPSSRTKFNVKAREDFWTGDTVEVTDIEHFYRAFLVGKKTGKLGWVCISCFRLLLFKAIERTWTNRSPQAVCGQPKIFLRTL